MYRISKSYTDQPSKNKPNYEVGLSKEEAVSILAGIAKEWGNSGGEVVEQTEDSLTVCEGNGEGEIVFEIIED